VEVSTSVQVEFQEVPGFTVHYLSTGAKEELLVNFLLRSLAR
jgi:hypothetical protein